MNPPFATRGESPDEWYEREKTAFRAWWESDDNEKTFSSTPTMAAGAGWFARAEAAPETAPIVPCLATNGCTTPERCARNGDACRVKTPVSETAQKPSCIYRTGCETPNDCREHGYCRSPRNAAPQEAPAARPAMEGSGDSQSTTRPTQPSSVEPAVAAPVSVPSATPCSADELKRLREIEHLAWHVLDDSAEDATTGNISIVPRDDYFKLCELLPEGHP